MSETLYNLEILKLAAATASLARLAEPQASVERRSPVCGSRVTVDLCLNAEGQIEAIGQEVRACALGQASAALLQAHALGHDAAQLANARDTLAAYLHGERDDPGEWPGLSLFAPARPHRARHASILLAFEAAAEAAQIAAR